MFSKAIHFEEKSSYGCFWKNNFCHLSFCFNLYTSHKTCEQAATSVHEQSTQNKQQQLACCPAKVIFPWLSDWVLVLSSVNWAFPPLSCITPALLSFPASQSWASSNASFIKKTLLVGCTPEFADWYYSITLIVIRASCCQPPTHSEVYGKLLAHITTTTPWGYSFIFSMVYRSWMPLPAGHVWNP